MKTKSLTVVAVLTVGISLGTLTSCNQNSHQEHKEDNKTEKHDGHNHEHEAKKEIRKVSGAVQKSKLTNEIVSNYLLLKNALVKDDSKEAAKAGGLLLTAFNNFDMGGLSADKNKEYMEIAESAKEQAEHIIKSPIPHQREHFEALSTDIFDLITLVGTEKTLYQDFCPMASGGKGAIWISEIKEIQNPYMGSKMLKCGSIKKQFN